MPLPELSDFPAQNYDKIRYGDTDRQGHVNNAVFSTLYETGRMIVLEAAQEANFPADASFVIARIAIDYRAEIVWPGTVEIGSGVKAIGNSSITLSQALFQNGKCVSTAESVMVQLDGAKRAAALGAEMRQYLLRLMLK